MATAHTVNLLSGLCGWLILLYVNLNAGLIAPSKLRESTIEWINTKRLELKSLMWDHAGILRRTQDMGPALQRLNAMAVEAEVHLCLA